MNRSSAALVFTLAVFFASEASASGFLVARFGGEHGHPTTDNATAMYYNPAGLALGRGTSVFLDGSLAWRTFKYTRDEGAIDNLLSTDQVGDGTPDTPEGRAANAGEGSLSNILGAPFFGVQSDLGIEGLGLGLGFYAPFGGSSVYDRRDYDPNFPGAEDGAQRWWVVEGTIRSLYFTGAAAYNIKPAKLSVGLGVNVVKSEIKTIRGRNAEGTDWMVTQFDTDADGTVEQSRIREGRAVLDVSSIDISVGAGVVWHPTDDVWVGASWQSSPGFGENRLEGTFQQVLVTGPVEDKKDASVYQTMPDVYRLGGRYRPNSTSEIRLFGDFVRWSLFEEQRVISGEDTECTDTGKLACIPRNWENAYGVRAGYSYWLNPGVELFVGAGFDANAVPDDTLDPSLYDTDKVTGSLGGRFELLDDALAIAAAYTQVVYFEREIDPRAKDANGRTVLPSSVAKTHSSPDAAGKYEQAVGVFNLNVEYTF